MYTFNLASLLAFSSIIMTYFGVNFYFHQVCIHMQQEIHVPIPDFIPYSIVIVFIISSLAFYKQKNIKKNEVFHPNSSNRIVFQFYINL